MDPQEPKLKVLARIPYIGADTGPIENWATLPSSVGRVIGQALSFKLLAGIALLLVVMAVAPLTIGRSSRPMDSPAVADAPPAQESTSRLSDADAPPAQASAVAETPAATPTPANSSPIPAARPPRHVVGKRAAPAPTEVPLMSPWPNPAYPVSYLESGVEQPRTGVNQAMTIRP